MPEALILTELGPRLRVIFSLSSFNSLAISLIDFLGIMPVIVLSILSLMFCVDNASLCASVATDVIDVLSIVKNKPFK